MGFGMCSNIHAKINTDDELYICDINQAQLDRFVQESKGHAKVSILQTPKEVAEQCVRSPIVHETQLICDVLIVALRTSS